LNLSQLELGEKVGVSERSIYSYEQTGAFPRKTVLKKLAESLRVSVTYLSNEGETDKFKNIDTDFFIDEAKAEYGIKGAKEAQAILAQATALFAGGELDDDAKEIFFQSLMEVYLESKADAREKFTPRKRASRKK
jgi:transcriptional regulator with XRE-family HTH domain